MHDIALGPKLFAGDDSYKDCAAGEFHWIWHAHVRAGSLAHLARNWTN